MFVSLGNNQGIILRLLLSHILAHQVYRPLPDGYSSTGPHKILHNLNFYEYRKEIIQIQKVEENSEIYSLHQDDLLRFYSKDNENNGILKVEAIKNKRITDKAFTDFSYSIGTEKGSIFQVHSRIMRPGEVIETRDDQ